VKDLYVRLRRVCFVFVLGFMLAASGMLAATTAKAETSVSWTFALYVNGDNDLERYWEETTLPGLLGLPANSDIRIVAMVDRLKTEGTELIEVAGGEWQVVNTYPEMNFGDGATFGWFLTEVSTLYPSEKLSVTGWNHGYGWIEFSFDQTSWDRIRTPELKAAIEGAGVHIDLLSFDACNMANTEVVYEVWSTGLVDYLVGSEEGIPVYGFPYDHMLTPVALDPTRTPAQVAVDLVNGWAEYYDQTAYVGVSLSAVDVGALGGSGSTVQTWCGLMHDNLASYKRVYRDALKNSYIMWGTKYFVDMVDLGETLLADSKFSNAELRAETVSMMAAIEGSVIAVHASPDIPDSRGLTLYWGVKGDWKYYGPMYAETQFGIDMGWWAFLQDYNA
jgi:hypothetical protein